MRTVAKPQSRRIGTGFEALEARSLLTTLPNGFTETVVAANIDSPTAMARADDGRFFIAEQGGDLRVVKNNTLLANPFVSLSVLSGGERGLLGVALDPQFESNNYVYVYYTVPGNPPHNRVSRFEANGDVAAAGSETILLELDNLSSATNHNGGAIHFGTDEKLYIATGDNANGANAQSLSTTHGKILRINPDPQNLIPSDNPFLGTTSGIYRSIWAYGLRNPYTFNVHPTSGKIFINDVGQNSWEEINEGIAGANYGWPATEGPTTNPDYETPVFAYQHFGSQPAGNVITGGTFYDPANFKFPPAYKGDYFFTDAGAGWIWRYDLATDSAREFATGASGPVDLLASDDGDLYYLSRGNNDLRRIRFSNAPPVIRDARATSRFNEPVQASDPQYVKMLSQARVTDADQTRLPGGRLTVGFTAGRTTDDRLMIVAEAGLTTSNNQLRYQGTLVGTYSISTTDRSLSIVFNKNTTPFIASVVLRRIAFTNAANDPVAGNRTLQFQITDGLGGVSAPVSHVVTVVPRSGRVATASDGAVPVTLLAANLITSRSGSSPTTPATQTEKMVAFTAAADTLFTELELSRPRRTERNVLSEV